MTTTILITDFDYADLRWERERAESAGVELRSAQVDTPAGVVDAARESNADALLTQYAPVTADVFEELSLAVVGRYGTGVDNVDVVAATEHGVPVVNVPTYADEEVSTHALSLLLACARRIPQYDRAVKAGTWDWKRERPLHRLRGETLGLVGFGSIARRLTEKVVGFDLEVLTFDPYVEDEAVRAHDVETVAFEALLERSDAVSVHSPLTEETRGLFDGDAFERMRETAILVNTARGAIVDATALAEALRDGEIAAAGLDVLPEEPPGPDHPLFDRDDAILTPHVGWYSEESIGDLRRTVIDDVIGVLSGEDPTNRVNPEVLE